MTMAIPPITTNVKNLIGYHKLSNQTKKWQRKPDGDPGPDKCRIVAFQWEKNILILEIQLSKGKGSDLISLLFNLAACLCLFQARTYISNVVLTLIFTLRSIDTFLLLSEVSFLQFKCDDLSLAKYILFF